MRRILAGILLLALLLTLAACAPAREEDPAPPDEPPQEEQHLTADVPEEKVWQRDHGAVWGSEPAPVSADFERISGAADNGMTVG